VTPQSLADDISLADEIAATLLHTFRSTDAITSATLDGVITSWNGSAEHLYGWRAAECIGRHLSLVVPAERHSELEVLLASVRCGAPVGPIRTEHMHQSGGRQAVTVTLVPLRDRDGKVISVAAVARAAEDSTRTDDPQPTVLRREPAEQHRVVFDMIPHGVWIADANGCTEGLNRWGAEHLGVPPDAIHGWDWLQLVHPDDAEQARSGWEAALRSGTLYVNEYRLRQPDGSYHWHAARAVGVRSRDGRLRQWVGTWTDIDDRKRAEQRLAHDARLLSQVRDAVVVTDMAGVVTHWNEGATRVFGWTAADMVGQPLLHRVPKSARPAIAELIARVADGAEFAGEFEDYRKDGSRVWIDARVSTITDSAGRPMAMMGISHDISARKQAEADRDRLDAELRQLVDHLETANLALRASEERCRQITDSISEVFWLTTVDKREMQYLSAAFDAIWGRSRSEAIATPNAWMDAIHPEDRDRVIEAATTKQVRGDYDEEYRIVRPDGTIRWIRDRAFPVRDEHGQVVRVAGVAEDITARRRLEEQLRQSQKMEAIGQLAGGIAHDFNNLLTVIGGNSELLAARAPDANRELVEEIVKAVGRAAGLTRQLLAFSRKQVLAPQLLDLNRVVADTERMLRRVIGEDITLTIELQRPLPSIRADLGQLEQVLLNLAVNARDAMPLGGILTIRTMSDGDDVVLDVADTGIGMSDAVKRHVFEPFFTTKPVGKGTGLGLAAVHGFVAQSHGRVTVDSEPGRGSSFRIWLPAANATPLDRDGARPEKPALAHGVETILLVEDEDGVRALIERVLCRAGYHVLTAATAAEAEDVAERHATPIDLLVTDVVMPDRAGPVLAEQLLVRHPEMKVLYVSGYTDDAVVRRGVVGDVMPFLQKPFSPGVLTQKIRQVLAGETPS
jgi:two-component system cell cycle sensor histidine kinase/response regulator CckA